LRRRFPARTALFIGIVAACVGVGAGYAGWAAVRSNAASVGDDARAAAAAIARLPTGTRVVFQHYSRARSELGNVGIVRLGDRRTSRVLTPLICERVYYAVTGGLCLKSQQGVLSAQYRVTVFGLDFDEESKLTLTGIPSRARISPDGRYGAVTAFVLGHSYRDKNFSTQTLLIEMATGSVIEDLEKFELVGGTKVRSSPDFNYWGVTFARDSNRFYATLRTRGKTFLVEGDVRSRKLRVLRENVECPSLSPDNTRIAFKKLLGGKQPAWRLHVLDLATMAETPLAETRSIDDQVEWLDNRRILYGAGEAIWTVPADGSGSPRQLLAEALSPAVVRA
jgi:hypothetical protein